ncbi:MAG TPA: type II CAAX endopeptidase family protein [Nocardioides sp.]|nr:type II CAAX endopeptidase family protein [Nocardioides sp.]
MSAVSNLVAATPRTSRAARPGWWTWLAVAELVVAVTTILLDLAIPSLLILLLAGISLVVRRQGPSSLGLRRPRRAHLVAGTAGFAVLWSVFQLAVTMPVANHLSGERQDMGVFADVQGDVGLLVLLVVLSWTLGAFVEELAFRGFLLTRLRELLGSGRVALAVAVLVSSVLFGILHSEQGLVGVVVVALDGIAFCALRLGYGTVWASVLAHGFNNTLGLVTFFLVGPVYGLW